jgi:hypothetical protein
VLGSRLEGSLSVRAQVRCGLSTEPVAGPRLLHLIPGTACGEIQQEAVMSEARIQPLTTSRDLGSARDEIWSVSACLGLTKKASIPLSCRPNLKSVGPAMDAQRRTTSFDESRTRTGESTPVSNSSGRQQSQGEAGNQAAAPNEPWKLFFGGRCPVGYLKSGQ